ncbi:MAG: NAD(P)-dependent oxidoreductase [Frankiales bacterium]|nr:NAD(P)-dependent oxidoreductase [Frankiales bacterium]
MSTILVTGGTGFVGRHVLEALTRAGQTAHVAARRISADAGGDWHESDLLAPLSAAGLVAEVAPTHLLHLAWCADPGSFWTDPANVAWAEATLRLVRAFADAGGRRVVVAGTCAEYDPSAGRCSEDATPLKPTTLYGACKAATFTALSAFCAQAGVELAWGRIFNVYGPGEPAQKLVSAVAAGLLAGQPVETTAGTQVRDFVSVRDVAEGLTALTLGTAVGAYNLGTGVGTPVRDVARAVADLTGRPELLRPTRPPAADEPPLLVADVHAAQAAFGWQASTSLGDGLRETVDAVRARTGS